MTPHNCMSGHQSCMYSYMCTRVRYLRTVSELRDIGLANALCSVSLSLLSTDVQRVVYQYNLFIFILPPAERRRAPSIYRSSPPLPM